MSAEPAGIARFDELAACGAVVTGLDGHIASVNDTFAAMLDRSSDDLAGGVRFLDLLSPGARIYYDTHVLPMLLVEGRAKEIAVDLVRVDGDRLPTLLNAVLQRDDHGEPVAIHYAVFDASDRRSYETQLLDAKRAAEASERLTAEMARTLQATLIPPEPPVIAGLELGAAYRPAGTGDEVGGDFYDVFEVEVDDWLVVVGDVSGKGVDAAVVTAHARHAIRGLALRHPDPSDLLRELNAALLARGRTRYCTVALLRLQRTPSGWSLRLSTGGHPFPLLARAGEVHDLGRAGSIVGAVDRVGFHTVRTALAPGDVLLVFTDGVTEARKGRGEFYGEERLHHWLAANVDRSVGPLVDSLVEELVAFQDQVPRDDIVALALRIPADEGNESPRSA